MATCTDDPSATVSQPSLRCARMLLFLPLVFQIAFPRIRLRLNERENVSPKAGTLIYADWHKDGIQDTRHKLFHAMTGHTSRLLHTEVRDSLAFVRLPSLS